MKKLIALFALAIVGFGCSNSGSGPADNSSTTRASTLDTPTPAPAATPASVAVPGPAQTPAPTTASAADAAGYFEVEYKGRFYVAATKETADKIAGGIGLEMSVTKIGAGPDGQTLVIEATKSGVEKELLAEYAKRHPAK